MNIRHLYAGTPKQNTRDMLDRGRHARVGPRGEQSGMAKLTTEQVMDIRLGKKSRRELATEYGISERTVSQIRAGRRWAHLPGIREFKLKLTPGNCSRN